MLREIFFRYPAKLRLVVWPVMQVAKSFVWPSLIGCGRNLLAERKIGALRKTPRSPDLLPPLKRFVTDQLAMVQLCDEPSVTVFIFGFATSGTIHLDSKHYRSALARLCPIRVPSPRSRKHRQPENAFLPLLANSAKKQATTHPKGRSPKKAYFHVFCCFCPKTPFSWKWHFWAFS